MPPQEEGWSYSRRIAQPFVQSAATRYDVFARWYEEAREGGISYRRSDMLSDWRREKGLVLHQVECEGLSAETKVPERLFTPTDWPGMTNKYQYVFRYTAEDKETKERFEDVVAVVATDRELLPGEAWEEFEGSFRLGQPYDWMELVDFQMFAVRRRTWGMD